MKTRKKFLRGAIGNQGKPPHNVIEERFREIDREREAEGDRGHFRRAESLGVVFKSTGQSFAVGRPCGGKNIPRVYCVMA